MYSNTYEFFIFFLIFENPVYPKMFKSYLQIVLFDYPETSWVYCVVFLENIQIAWLLMVFFKYKKKFRRLDNISYVFGQIDKSILTQEKLGYRFF